MCAVRNTPLWSALLRERGLKSTPARTGILDVLNRVQKPLTVEQIGEKLKKLSLDTVTLYRAVKQLTDAGLLRHVDFHHGHAHYELKDVKSDHHHIVCTECHTVEDFTGCDFSDLAKHALAQTKSFRTVVEHSVELFGICKKCEKK
ncbi:MAG: Fur family transcriptional regulator [Patescibacteria group bacterium]